MQRSPSTVAFGFYATMDLNEQSAEGPGAQLLRRNAAIAFGDGGQ